MVDITPEELCARGRVAVIDEPAISHAIAVVGDGDGGVILHDPLSSVPMHWTCKHLGLAYGGVAILIEPVAGR